MCGKHMDEKGEKRKVAYSAGGNETEIDFVLVGKGNRQYLRDVKVIPGELQHRLMVTDLVKKAKKSVRKKAIDLFRLYIFFSQYRSCDNTQEVWSFVLFIKMSACKREYAYMHSF